MNSSDVAITSDQAPPGTDPSTAPQVRPRPHQQVWAIALTAGLAAGLVSGLAGELVYGVFQPRLVTVSFPMGVSLLMPTAATQNQADFKNAVLVFTMVGGLTGLALGFAGGLVSRSRSRGAIVGLCAMMVGGLVAAGASLALVPLFYRHYVPDTNDLLTPTLIHACIWAAIGAVGGLAFGIGLRSWRVLPAATAGACLGAIMAAVLFHLLGASLFWESGSTEPLASSSPVRLLAMLLLTVLVAAGAARGALRGGSLPSTRGSSSP